MKNEQIVKQPASQLIMPSDYLKFCESLKMAGWSGIIINLENPRWHFGSIKKSIVGRNCLPFDTLRKNSPGLSGF
jgi:hypothetical protein